MEGARPSFEQPVPDDSAPVQQVGELPVRRPSHERVEALYDESASARQPPDMPVTVQAIVSFEDIGLLHAEQRRLEPPMESMRRDTRQNGDVAEPVRAEEDDGAARDEDPVPLLAHGIGVFEMLEHVLAQNASEAAGAERQPGRIGEDASGPGVLGKRSPVQVQADEVDTLELPRQGQRVSTRPRWRTGISFAAMVAARATYTSCAGRYSGNHR
jgi:hypothetical protein